MSKPRIAIIDYGMGNIRSVANAVDAIGGIEDLVSDPDSVKDYDKVILPGVGAFANAMQCLRDSGMQAALNEYKASGKGILGICLGMQLLCASSDEDGEHQGLNWFDAQVRRFPDQPGLIVPHMGWNEISFKKESPVIAGVEANSDVYFVHSYCVRCEDKNDVLAETSYGVTFASMIERENVIGMQFHPEKSQNIGLRLIQNFAEVTDA